MKDIHEQIGSASAYDAIGRGGGRGGGFRGGFRGGSRGGVARGGRWHGGGRGRWHGGGWRGRGWRAYDVTPWWPWWGSSWWYPWASTYTAAPQQLSDACTALGRAIAQGAPPETIQALRAACAQLVYEEPQEQVAAPAPYAPSPWGRPGYLAY